jgi:hypothetical protein
LYHALLGICSLSEQAYAYFWIVAGICYDISFSLFLEEFSLMWANAGVV